MFVLFNAKIENGIYEMSLVPIEGQVAQRLFFVNLFSGENRIIKRIVYMP